MENEIFTIRRFECSFSLSFIASDFESLGYERRSNNGFGIVH